MSESIEETEPSFDEVYSRRRIVETGTPVEVTLRGVGRGSEGELGVKVDVVGDEYFVTFSDVSEEYGDLSGSGGLLSFLSECVTFDGSLESIVSEEVSVKFNEEFTRCDFPDSDSYRFVLSEDIEEFESIESIDGLSRDELLFYISYFRDGDGEKPGVKCQVTSVTEGGSEERFRVEVDNGVVWEFTVPKTTDPEGSDVARLIETVGQGQISFLEDEHVYVVHESDEDLNLDSCGLDESGMWYLVTPEDWESWDEYEEPSYSESTSEVSNRRPSTSSDSSTSSSSSSGSDDSAITKKNGVMLIAQGFMVMFMYEIVFASTVQGMSEGGDEATLEFISTLDSVMAVLPAVCLVGGIGIIVMSQVREAEFD